MVPFGPQPGNRLGISGFGTGTVGPERNRVPVTLGRRSNQRKVTGTLLNRNRSLAAGAASCSTTAIAI
jgi:hypothetical protein